MACTCKVEPGAGDAVLGGRAEAAGSWVDIAALAVGRKLVDWHGARQYPGAATGVAVSPVLVVVVSYCWQRAPRVYRVMLAILP